MELGGTAQSQAGFAMMAQTLQNATMGADVVSKTLTAVNQINTGSGNSDQDFQTKVLMAEAAGKGLSLDANI